MVVDKAGLTVEYICDFEAGLLPTESKMAGCMIADCTARAP